jgi:hypothetical protein
VRLPPELPELPLSRVLEPRSRLPPLSREPELDDPRSRVLLPLLPLLLPLLPLLSRSRG